MNYSLYLHIPFCVHRCAYCDFNTYAGQEDQLPAYVEALRTEIRSVGRSTPERLRAGTIFFGGGTPSLLTPVQFASIFETIHAAFDLAPQAEVSLEANPGTLTREALEGLRRVGFNRISLGVQSAHPEELHLLERIHDYVDVLEAVTWARQAGFDNLNLDLIFGLPEQRLERWQATVDLILGLHPEHLSFYALTLEHGTPFGRWAQRGLLPLPDPDRAADMYEWAEERLAAAGYEHYEISNWARPGRECRHNLTYWRNQPYLGFGAGAHGYAGGVRYSNVLRIGTYIDRLASNGEEGPAARFPLSPAAVNQQRISAQVEMEESMITGLRLTREGISAAAFRERFGWELMQVFGREIDDLIRLGLLEWESTDSFADSRTGTDSTTDSQTDKRMKTDGVLRLTKRGRLLGNQVFIRFVG